MALSIKKEEALKLRSQGFSIKEISKKVGAAQSTVSVWVRDVSLDETAIQQ